MRTRARRIAWDSLHAARAGPVQVIGWGHAEDPTPRLVRRQLYWTWSRGFQITHDGTYGEGERLGVSLALRLRLPEMAGLLVRFQPDG
jgi:hypothetical protein